MYQSNGIPQKYPVYNNHSPDRRSDWSILLQTGYRHIEAAM